MSFLNESKIISILNEEGVTYNVEKGGEVPSDVKPGDTVNVSEGIMGELNIMAMESSSLEEFLGEVYKSYPQHVGNPKIKEFLTKYYLDLGGPIDEGKLKKALTGIALFTALIAGNNAITNSNPQMKSLKAAYEQAKDSGDEVKMKELKDKITKQTIYLDTGKGEPQSVKEIVKKCYQRGMTKENISKVIKEYKKRSTKHSIEEEYAPMELPAAKTPNFLGDDGMDYEGGMAKSQMLKMKNYAKALCDMIDDDTQLESWVQAKLTKASDYMSSVYHYLDYQQSKMNERRLQFALNGQEVIPNGTPDGELNAYYKNSEKDLTPDEIDTLINTYDSDFEVGGAYWETLR